MRNQRIPELPPLIQSNKARYGFENEQYEYPQSSRSSYQPINFNSNSISQTPSSNYGSQTHRIAAPQSYSDVDYQNKKIQNNEQLNELNYSKENMRNNSMISENRYKQNNKQPTIQSTSNKKYLNVERNQNEQFLNQNYKDRTGISQEIDNNYYLDQNINHKYNQNDLIDIQQQDGESRTSFYSRNRDKKYRPLSQTHHQNNKFINDEEKQYNLNNNNHKIYKQDNQSNYYDDQNLSTDSKTANSNVMPPIDNSQNKIFFPKTSENYKFFLNSALRDIHGIYQQNQQNALLVDSNNHERKRYGSTLKSSQTSSEFNTQPQRRMNSQTATMRQPNQDHSLQQLNQNPSKEYIIKNKLGERQFGKNSAQEIQGSPYLINNPLVLNQNRKFEQNDIQYINEPNQQHQIKLKNRNSQNRTSLDFDSGKSFSSGKNGFLDNQLNQVNKNHLRRNFNSRRIEELSKPKNQVQKQIILNEKDKSRSSVQKKRQQSPQLKQSDEKPNKKSEESNVLNHNQLTSDQLNANTVPMQNSSLLINNSKLQKKNQNNIKSDITQPTQQNENTSHLQNQTMIQDDNDDQIDLSFENLQNLVKQQNNMQYKIQSNTSPNFSSVDKIRILTGKGKFHFSKNSNFNSLQQQNNSIDDLTKTKQFFEKQKLGQVKNEKIERILFLKDTQQNQNLDIHDEPNFTNKSFQSNLSSIPLNTHNNQNQISSNSKYYSSKLSNFQPFKGLNKYKSEKIKQKKIVDFKVNYGFKLDKEIQYYKKQKEQQEQKQREESEQKIKELKQQNCKQIYERERYRDLEVDIIIHQEEIQSKLVFGEKVSLIKIPVISNCEDLDIKYINKIDESNTLCTSQQLYQGHNFIIRKEKLTDLKGQHYVFHLNSLMAKENNLYIKDPIAVRVDSEYYLVQFFKFYQTLQDILLTANSSTLETKPSFFQQQQSSDQTFQTNSDLLTNKENYEEEQKDQAIFDENQIIFIYQQILQNVCMMNEILNVYHSNLTLENIGIFDGDIVSIINYDDAQIIYGKQKGISQKNYILSENNLSRLQFQKYVKYEALSSSSSQLSNDFSAFDYQLHDIICAFIQIKFMNPYLLSENQFKQGIKIINLEQQLSLSGQVIKQLIQYQQLYQHNLLSSYSSSLSSYSPNCSLNFYNPHNFQTRFSYIDQILFYFTTMQLQKAHQIINTFQNNNDPLDVLIFKAILYYLQKDYEKSYEQLILYEDQQKINSNKNIIDKKNEIIGQQILDGNMIQNNQDKQKIEFQNKLDFWKGRIEFMIKQFEKCNVSFDKYINESQNKCQSLLNLADFYKHIANLNKSISYYEQAEQYVVNKKENNLYQIYYVQIMKRQIYFYQNTENKQKQLDCIKRCIQFLTQAYQDQSDCELSSFKSQFSHFLV